MVDLKADATKLLVPKFCAGYIMQLKETFKTKHVYPARLNTFCVKIILKVKFDQDKRKKYIIIVSDDTFDLYLASS